MTELTKAEKCKLIAEALGIKVVIIDDCCFEQPPEYLTIQCGPCYDPYRYDAQAMEVVKEFRLDILSYENGIYEVTKTVTAINSDISTIYPQSEDLNTAIVECAVQAIQAGWSKGNE